MARTRLLLGAIFTAGWQQFDFYIFSSARAGIADRQFENLRPIEINLVRARDFQLQLWFLHFDNGTRSDRSYGPGHAQLKRPILAWDDSHLERLARATIQLSDLPLHLA